jgi:hypothetical protein
VWGYAAVARKPGVHRRTRPAAGWPLTMRPQRRHGDPFRHRGPDRTEAVVIVALGTLALVVALAAGLAYPLLVLRP